MDKITYRELKSEILAGISDISSSRLFSHQRLNRPAVNAVQSRHYPNTLIYTNIKTRFSTGKQRNSVRKCLYMVQNCFTLKT